MFLKIIKSNSIISLALPAVFALAIWGSMYFLNGYVHEKTGVPFFNVIFGWFGRAPLFAVIMGLGILLLEAYMWNGFINKQGLLKQTNYFPAVFYIFLCSCRPVLISVYPTLIASLFLILAFKRLAGSYKKENALSEAFDAGIFIGIASLLYFPVAIFVVFLWIGLLTIRSLIWREWVVSLIGFVLPFGFVLAYYSVFYSPETFWFDNLVSAVGKHPATPVLAWQQIALAGALGIIILISFFVFLTHFSDNIVKNQKLSALMVWFACFSAATVIISPERDARSLTLLALPLSFIFSRYFLRAKSRVFPQLLFILLLAAIVINIFF